MFEVECAYVQIFLESDLIYALLTCPIASQGSTAATHIVTKASEGKTPQVKTFASPQDTIQGQRSLRHKVIQLDAVKIARNCPLNCR